MHMIRNHSLSENVPFMLKNVFDVPFDFDNNYYMLEDHTCTKSIMNLSLSVCRESSCLKTPEFFRQ